MADEGLQVWMFGGFNMTYHNVPLAIGRNTTSKVGQLLQFLLYTNEKGVPRDMLLEILFGREQLSDPATSLRANVFRLRRLLEEAGLPKDDYVTIQKGIYRWTEKIPVSIDARTFDKLAEQGLREKDPDISCELLEQACRLVRGQELLPNLAGEEWVACESARLQKRYFECLRRASALLKGKGRYDTVVELMQPAAEHYMMEEWYLEAIDCLICMNQFDRAFAVYENAVTTMSEELGLAPSADMLRRFRTMSAHVQNASADDIQSIQKGLEEEEKPSGAYYCSYPSFVDSYRVLTRTMSRTGLSLYLMLCTLTDRKGDCLSDRQQIAAAAPKLKNAIATSLRQGDFFTQYSNTQFLILLVGTKREDCRLISDRITVHFWDGRVPARPGIRYYAATAADMSQEWMHTFLKEGTGSQAEI